MFCDKCGQYNDRGASKCDFCGKVFVQKETRIEDIPSSQTKPTYENVNGNINNLNSYDNNSDQYNTQYSTNITNKSNNDIMLIVIGFFVPILGIVLYFLWKKKKPNEARNIGIGTIVSSFIIIICIIVLMIKNGNNDSEKKAQELEAYCSVSTYCEECINDNMTCYYYNSDEELASVNCPC